MTRRDADPSSLPDSNPGGRPLALRLRTEAKDWDERETIVPLLLEAAEAIEHLAARVAELEYERR